MDYTIYVKTTNDCNLNCKHCYNTQMKDRSSMCEYDYDNVKLFLENFRLSHMNDQLNVQFHGGEPMLGNLAKMKSLVEDTQHCKLRWSITTNLTYQITQDCIDFFKLMKPYDDKPYIMTSWDYQIRFRDDEEDKWKENVKTLLMNNIQVQPIVCVTKQLVDDNSPSQILQMLKQLGVSHVNFERITNNGNAKTGQFAPTNRDVDQWLFDAYIETKRLGMYVPLFENVEDSAKGFLNGCRARQCMKTVLTINPNCTVSTCPNVANYTIGKLISGNIQYDKLSKMQLESVEKIRDPNCFKCKYYRYCNCECCQLRYDYTGCPGLTKLYKYLLK